MHAELIAEASSLDAPVQNILLEAANELQRVGGPLKEETVKKLEETGCSYAKCLDFLGLYIGIIREFPESDPKEFNKNLLVLGYSEEFVDNCISQLSQLPLERAVFFDKLVSFKWKIDASFFNSKSLEKIPVPIVVNLTVNSGKKVIIELDRKAFHKLRFTVAVLLKEMLNITNVSSLKL